MISKMYLQPVGIGAGVACEAALASGGILPLAGGPLSFAGALLIEGNAQENKRHYLTARDLAESRDERVQALAARLIAPRPTLAPDAGARPLVMGIVNVTPDSFSDGGVFASAREAIDHAFRLIDDGADILDIGGESTRPGSDPVPLEVERERVLPVLEALRGVPVLVSLDTRKAALMREAAGLGVDMINDVSALTYDGDAAAALADQSSSVVLMHAKGDPKTMQDAPRYDDVALEVYDMLAERIAAAEAAGIARARLIVDPGIGFGKSFDHNLQLMRQLALFHGLGVTLMLGASRKGFVGHVTGVKVAADRVAGSVAMALAGVAQGAQILRVHDVAATNQALAAWCAATG